MAGGRHRDVASGVLPASGFSLRSQFEVVAAPWGVWVVWSPVQKPKCGDLVLFEALGFPSEPATTLVEGLGAPGGPTSSLLAPYRRPQSLGASWRTSSAFVAASWP